MNLTIFAGVCLVALGVAMAVAVWPRRQHYGVRGVRAIVDPETGLRDYAVTPWLAGEKP